MKRPQEPEARAAVAWRRLFGSGPLSHQVETQALSAAGDAFVAVSLAGSLFFNVSVDAARPQVILYLLVTMAPFAVLAPLIGPVIDRVRGGHRMVVAFTCAARGVAAFFLADNVRSLLLYPQALAILVLGKTYSVAKNAIVPRLVAEADELVAANGRLSRVGTAGGAAGGAVAVGILNLAGSGWVLRVGALVYVAAALAAWRLPRPVKAPIVSRGREYEELHMPALVLASSAMGILRAGVGFLFFLLAFTLRTSAEPAWFFGAVFAAGGIGGVLATFVAPWARRRIREERLLMLALAGPAVVSVLAGMSIGRATILAAAGVLGIGATAGRQAFDALVQKHARDADRGRAFARFETRFQLSWVVGALVAVAGRPPDWLGLTALGGVLGFGAASYATGGHIAAVAKSRFRGTAATESSVDLAYVVLGTARRALAEGSHAEAVIHAASAAEVARAPSGDGSVGELRELRSQVVAAGVADGEVAERALALAELIVGPTGATGAGGPGRHSSAPDPA